MYDRAVAYIQASASLDSICCNKETHSGKRERVTSSAKKKDKLVYYSLNSWIVGDGFQNDRNRLFLLSARQSQQVMVGQGSLVHQRAMCRDKQPIHTRIHTSAQFQVKHSPNPACLEGNQEYSKKNPPTLLEYIKGSKQKIVDLPAVRQEQWTLFPPCGPATEIRMPKKGGLHIISLKTIRERPVPPTNLIVLWPKGQAGEAHLQTCSCR